MGGGCPSVRWSGGTYADEALSVSAATFLSATSSWLMAYLRLFRPHRGTQSLRFPDHDLPVRRKVGCACRANATLFPNVPSSGQEARFPPTRLRAGCGFRKETIAGMRRNGRDP